MSWRPMQLGDLAETNRVADIVHPAYPEDPAVQRERLALFPDGCWVAEGAGGIVGYAVTHPGRRRQPPALDTLLGSLPAGADCLYLHDIALLASARGTGLGAAIVPILRQVALRHRLAVLALTSVNGTVGYWQRQGFLPLAPDPALSVKLATYDADAAYMESPADAVVPPRQPR